MPTVKKSLKLNMLLNAIRKLLSLLFPLITFPYISRVLGVENIGRYSYANSIINYFVLLAGLGIESYAIREGAALREDKSALNQFANEMFTFNFFMTFISYLLLAFTTYTFSSLNEYRILLMILSFQIVLKTVGIEWFYSIYEDYLYITVRSIAFNILSLISLFCFVHTEGDLYIYAVISVFATAGSSMINYIHSRKYIIIRFTRNIDWKKHVRPVLVLFAKTLTATIYVNSDISLLGMICGDSIVGLYSVSTKIYSAINGLLGTILVVSIPRLSSQYGQGKFSEFRNTATDIYKGLITITLPVITGLIILREPIILLIAGQKYIEAETSLAILGIALFLSMEAWFWGSCILIPMKREEEVLKVTLFSAVLNLTLNLILIPKGQEKAAAFTTVLAEGCTLLWSMIRGKKLSNVKGEGITYIKSLLGCFCIVVINIITRHFLTSSFMYVVITVVLSIVGYAVVEIILKNETFLTQLAK